MGDQEDELVLVAKLRQHATLPVGEEGRIGPADHHQRMAAAEVAGVRCGPCVAPETVIAVA